MCSYAVNVYPGASRMVSLVNHVSMNLKEQGEREALLLALELRAHLDLRSKE